MKTATILGIIGVGIVIGAAGYFFYRRQKMKGVSCDTREMLSETERTTEPEPIDNAKLISEFAQCAKIFEGVFEALYQVADGTSENAIAVIADWNLRVKQIKDCPNLTNYWSSIFGTYKNLPQKELQSSAEIFIINVVFATGISRDTNKECIVGPATAQKYHAINGAELIEGAKLNVAMPCWQLGEVVLEKGILINIT